MAAARSRTRPSRSPRRARPCGRGPDRTGRTPIAGRRAPGTRAGRSSDSDRRPTPRTPSANRREHRGARSPGNRPGGDERERRLAPGRPQPGAERSGRQGPPGSFREGRGRRPARRRRGLRPAVRQGRASRAGRDRGVHTRPHRANIPSTSRGPTPFGAPATVGPSRGPIAAPAPPGGGPSPKRLLGLVRANERSRAPGRARPAPRASNGRRRAVEARIRSRQVAGRGAASSPPGDGPRSAT